MVKTTNIKVMQPFLDMWEIKALTFSILKDKKFDISWKVINCKAMGLQECDLGKRKRKADLLSLEDEEMIWSSGVLDGNSPGSLNCIVFFLVSQHTGTRGRQKHHKIRVEDLRIVRNVASSGLKVQPKLAKVDWRKDHSLTLRKSSILVDEGVQWLLFSSFSQNV